MTELLGLIGAIVRAHAEQHHPEVLDPDKHMWAHVIDLDTGFDGMKDLTIEEFNHWLQGWWLLSDDGGWKWWLCVFTRSPAEHIASGGDLIDFPYCNLDSPLPDADFSGFGLESTHISSGIS